MWFAAASPLPSCASSARYLDVEPSKPAAGQPATLGVGNVHGSVGPSLISKTVGSMLDRAAERWPDCDTAGGTER